MNIKWVVALSSLCVLLYLLSPVRSYTVYIEAQPTGDQRFHLVTRSGRNSFHGRDVNLVDERFVQANQKTQITLDPDQVQWFGSLGASLYHPEYFYETVEVEGGLFNRTITIEPVSWSDALSRSPTWVFEYPPMEDRTEAFLAARTAHRVILLSDVHYHLRALSTHYLGLYLRSGVDVPLRKSIEEASRIVPLLESGLYGDPAYESRDIAFHNAQIKEIRESLEDIRQRTFGGNQ